MYCFKIKKKKDNGLHLSVNIETGADPSAQINLLQGSHVIHETFIYRQS